MQTRIVFMGSPEFAIPTLQALAHNYRIVGVVTQPDRPAGRGRSLTPPPVKVLAIQLQLPVIQPKTLRNPEAMQQLGTWAPDLILVAAFGQILRPEVLDLPPFGSVNVHASLLPRWRGAAPIQAAIHHGDRQTGITIMIMDPGVDTGPILNQRAINISPQETAGSLSPKLAQLGADLLIETLPAYLQGDLQPIPQVGETTYAPMLKKEDGRLDFKHAAPELERKVRAYNPWPGAFMILEGGHLKVHRAHTENASRRAFEPGTRIIQHGFPAVATMEGTLVLDEVQPAGKKSMSGDTFLRGARNWESRSNHE